MVSTINRTNGAWDNLSMSEKADMMKVAVRNGITDLKTIREKYNEFAEGGYLDWKEKASKYKHLDIDNDSTYDYEGWYNENPQRAWDFLNDSPDAHFDDKYKTVYHPTFSTQSKYSGKKDAAHNPQGVIGGTWNKQGTVFTMSPDGYRGPVSMDERKWYLENAEDNGVQLREADGSLPIYDGIPWGGVLPNVTITGNRFARGGNLYAGTSTDDDLVDWIIREEGFNSKPEDIGDGKMTLGSGLTAKKWHDLYRKKGNKWSAADNRMAVAQEVADRRRWAEKNIPNWDTLPESSQKALLSYKYNYDFNAANSPKLFQALADSNLSEAARQMDATSKNAKFKKGLTDRRRREQEWFLKDVAVPQEPAISSGVLDGIREIPVSTSVANPFVTDAPIPEYVRPVMVPDESSYVKAHMQTPSEKRINNLRAFMQNLEDYDRMMSEYNVQNTPIYQFNAPYVVRSLGGNLFDGTSQPSQQMQINRGYWESQANRPTLEEELAEFRRQRALKVQKAIETLKSKEFKDNVEKTINKKTRANSTTSNDAIFNTTVSKNSHLGVRGEEGAKAHAAWEEEHPNLTAWGNVAGALPFAVASVPLGAGAIALGDALATTTTGQALTASLSPLYQAATGATIAGAPALAWADAGLTSAFGAHGISQAVEDGGISPMTALEVAPLGRLAKPVFREAATAVEDYRYPLGRPQVPDGYLTFKSQVRTKVGDVEIDNPNLLYHLDRGNGLGAFSDQGAYVENGFLFPGTPKDASANPYSWWNKGKPYSTSIKGQPMTRLMTATEDAPGMLHIRSQNYPIGQWNGKRGFVLNSEYVSPEGVNVSGSMYTLDPNYGWKRVSEEVPVAQWVKGGGVSASYLNGKPEIGMYFPDGKTFDTKAFARDLGAGIADARLFLGSEVKASSDAHNIELAKRVGFPRFTPYAKAQERASVYIKPELTADKSTLAGSIKKNTNNPALDKMTINILYDADKGGFHETLHRGNYGEEGFSFDPKTMDFMDYHQIQEDTRGLYKFKTDKLLVPRTSENAEWHDYMSRSAEAATNSMELGRRMGLEPGAPWPGKKKAMELFEKYSNSEDPKTKAFNVLNWKQKPRRVWDALTGRYFVLGAGTVSSTSLLNN